MTHLRRGALALLVIAGALVLVVMFTPVVPWWARTLAGPWNDPTGEVLIVLGGSGLEDGLLGISSYWRSVYAIRADREGQFTRVVISGGGPTDPAAAMRQFLLCQGVPPDHVVVEERSTSTHENAVNVKQLLAHIPGRKVLLTSDYHMFRAYRAFRKAGVEVLPRPFPDAIKRSSSYPERWPIFINLCEEAVKSAYYFMRGWL